MESEGPYTIDSKGEIWWILFDGEKVQTAPKDLVCYSTLVCSLLNTAYAEGRKSMEKELEELLEFVNRIMGFFRRHTYCPRCKSDIDHTFECEVENAADSVLINFSRKCIDDFYVWKNARGIE